MNPIGERAQIAKINEGDAVLLCGRTERTEQINLEFRDGVISRERNLNMHDGTSQASLFKCAM
jgi:hypothetical protein